MSEIATGHLRAAAVGSQTDPVTLAGQSLTDFVAALGARQPTPGGGAAAAVAAALGAATVRMAFAHAVGSKTTPAGAQSTAGEAEARLGEIASACLQLADADSVAFASVTAARGMPRSAPQEQAARLLAIQANLHVATETPLRLLDGIAAAMALAAGQGAVVPKGLRSDLAGGAELLHGAARCAAHSIAINVAALHDAAAAAAAGNRCSAGLAAIEADLERIQALVAGG